MSSFTRKKCGGRLRVVSIPSVRCCERHSAIEDTIENMTRSASVDLHCTGWKLGAAKAKNPSTTRVGDLPNWYHLQLKNKMNDADPKDRPPL